MARSGYIESIPIAVRIDMKKLAALGTFFVSKNTVLACKGNIVSLAVDLAYAFLMQRGEIVEIKDIEEAYLILENIGLRRSATNKLPPGVEALVRL